MIIEANSSSFRLNLKELWTYRELLWTLAARDYRVQYAQTIIGLTWAILKPVLTILILTFVFGTVAKVGTDNLEVPHILYTTVGLCGWTYFASVASQAGMSIIGAQNMVKKIYFPRLIIPLAKAVTAFIDLGITLIIIAVLMGYHGVVPSTNIIWLPIFIFMAVITGLSAGIWLSSLTIRYRDFVHITPLLLQIGMFATPIAFPASSVPEQYQAVFYLNPLAGVIEGIRWSILGGTPPSYWAMISFCFIVIMFIMGLYYFNRVQRNMADIL